MSVPKAPMYKYHLVPGGEHQIWCARQVSAVKPVTKAHPMNQATHNYLRSGVLATDPSHPVASLLWSK